MHHRRRGDRLIREAVGPGQPGQRGVQRLLRAGVNPQQRLAGLDPAPNLPCSVSTTPTAGSTGSSFLARPPPRSTTV